MKESQSIPSNCLLFSSDHVATTNTLSNFSNSVANSPENSVANTVVQKAESDSSVVNSLAMSKRDGVCDSNDIGAATTDDNVSDGNAINGSVTDGTIANIAYSFVVDPVDEGVRVDRALIRWLQEYTPQSVKMLFVAKRVAVERDLSTQHIAKQQPTSDFLTNNCEQPILPSLRLKAGDRVIVFVMNKKDSVNTLTSRSVTVSPDHTAPPLDILYEDDDLLVVNKPPLCVMYPDARHRSDTLVGRVMAHCSDISLPIHEDTHRPGVVHRLDHGTSGAVIFAKTSAMLDALMHAIKERAITRIYHSFHSRALHPIHGSITAAIYRHPKHRAIFVAKPYREDAPETTRDLPQHWKHSHSVYRTIKTNNFKGNQTLTLCAWRLDTGRTHQIRAHACALKAPIIGDKPYERASRVPPFAMFTNISHQLLHASYLGMVHPRTHKTIKVAAPFPQAWEQPLELMGDNLKTLTEDAPLIFEKSYPFKSSR